MSHRKRPYTICVLKLLSSVCALMIRLIKLVTYYTKRKDSDVTAQMCRLFLVFIVISVRKCRDQLLSLMSASAWALATHVKGELSCTGIGLFFFVCFFNNSVHFLIFYQQHPFRYVKYVFLRVASKIIFLYAYFNHSNYLIHR